jgi:RNA polymerase sigma-70 factor (ECF subfamily)
MPGYTTYQDTELLTFIREGNEGAFTEIYDRYYKGVYRYLLGFVKDPMLAEDLLNEVFVKVWEIRDRLQIEASFGAYLYRTCHNRATNALKKIASDNRLRRDVLIHLQTLAEHELPQPDELEAYDRLLDAALDILPPQRRKVFELCRQQGRTYEQAAEELGVSVNTVKDHMSHALKALRAFLRDNGDIAMVILIIEQLF